MHRGETTSRTHEGPAIPAPVLRPNPRIWTLRRPLSKDELKDLLNDGVVACGEKAWRVHIYGIVDGDAQRWVQVGLRGFDRHSLLLELPYLADDADVVTIIEDWLADSTSVETRTAERIRLALSAA
ncbi:MAG TPA: hypothetical protein VM818_24935 [Vicinamibacterales bacterium]|nr:hypothetical protein [Vicinamibacterales bacterium]